MVKYVVSVFRPAGVYLLPLALALLIAALIMACTQQAATPADKAAEYLFAAETLPAEQPVSVMLDSLFLTHKAYVADGFDFPVGPPNAVGYYNAQPFGQNLHLGDDWNGTGGGDSDLGNPVYTIAHGWVSEIEHKGPGWGNVMRIIHRLPNGSYVESLYGHLLDARVASGDWVKRGDLIGRMGNADGRYKAHLHLELRRLPGMALGGGYSADTTGYLKPTPWIKAHRPRR